MRVNVVVKRGWILERFALELQDAIEGVTINSTGYPPKGPSPEPLTYFLPMKDIRHMPGVSGVKVGLFTHGLERSTLYAQQFDTCVTMNQALARHLVGVGAHDVVTIRPGTEPPLRPIAFGVCGRVYGKGRKGADLVENAVAAGFDVRACTEKTSRGIPPCPITHSIERRSAFYQTIDYLLVSSTDEGGPMPVLEAIAHGVPVIAPDVGFCWEFPVIRYKRGDWLSLEAVMRALSAPPTWKAWADGHRRLFGRLLKEARVA